MPNFLKIYAGMFLCSVLVLVLFAGCVTSSQSGLKNQKDGVLVSDSAGMFWISMPVYPRETLATNFSSGGIPIVRHDLIVDPDPSLELGIIYNDYPKALPNFQSLGSTSFFDTVQAGALQTVENARLIYSRSGTFHSHPMRDVCFEVPETMLKYHIRIIVVKPRMYQLIVVSALDVDASHEVDNLFSSFYLRHDQ
jgi:hypothetical protein